ncbi:MAG: 16S rRNA (guanine(966)-N(2))-methyltransferase RsmD [Myxococcota bacterium]|nr:16S rRNA (guanine(966)-N(2))-methyltransferase RsmD [Myxococcota bacterium]
MAAGGLRVTGGELGGRRFRAPGSGVRPTADRVRESLFTRLGDLSGQAVLDLYAGSGALGVESFSRGAASVVFVERSPRIARILGENLSTLGLADRARLVTGDAVATVRKLGEEGARFDLVLLDPPYAGDQLVRSLRALREAAVVSEGGKVVAEHARRHPVPSVPGWVKRDARSYGETSVTQFSPEQPAGGVVS